MSYHRFNIKRDEDGMSWVEAVDSQSLMDEIKQLTDLNNHQKNQIIGLKHQVDILMRVIKNK